MPVSDAAQEWLRARTVLLGLSIGAPDYRDRLNDLSNAEHALADAVRAPSGEQEPISARNAQIAARIIHEHAIIDESGHLHIAIASALSLPQGAPVAWRAWADGDWSEITNSASQAESWRRDGRKVDPLYASPDPEGL